MDWTELETSTNQDHVIKHVIGATVLGWFVVDDAAHFLLDIGLLWTIYVDGEMNLLPTGVGISELEVDEPSRAELAAEADLLRQQGREVEELQRVTSAPVECLITSVEFFGAGDYRLIAIEGESATLNVETSIEAGTIIVASN
jgi:hypothetical protein